MAKPGPKTPQGKNRSRFNAANHFMTSRLMLVLDEQQCDLDALRQCWHDAYLSRNPVEYNAVERAANSEWLLRRKEHQADKTTAKLFAECDDMDDWSDPQRARYERMERYVTSASSSTSAVNTAPRPRKFVANKPTPKPQNAAKPKPQTAPR